MPYKLLRDNQRGDVLDLGAGHLLAVHVSKTFAYTANFTICPKPNWERNSGDSIDRTYLSTRISNSGLTVNHS